MEAYKEAIAKCLSDPLGQPAEAIAAMLRTPPEAAWGDFAFPCFTLAKSWRQAPQQIAAQLAQQLTLAAPVAAVTAHGPYLNFTLDDDVLSREVLQAIAREGECYGHGDEGRGQKVVIDYSSPNIAKELAFHHIRSTMIGHALKQILEARGYTVEGDNHLGRLGHAVRLAHRRLRTLRLGRCGGRRGHRATQRPVRAGAQRSQGRCRVCRRGAPVVPAPGSGRPTGARALALVRRRVAGRVRQSVRAARRVVRAHLGRVVFRAVHGRRHCRIAGARPGDRKPGRPGGRSVGLRHAAVFAQETGWRYPLQHPRLGDGALP